MFKIITSRILKYLLLFICEFLLVWVIVILEVLIKGYWGDTPLYFVLIFIFLYAITCSLWARLALTGDKKKKMRLGLISGAVVGFMALWLDDSLGLQILQLTVRFFHIPVSFMVKYFGAYKGIYIVTIILIIMFQIVFWEIQHHKGVISFRKNEKGK